MIKNKKKGKDSASGRGRTTARWWRGLNAIRQAVYSALSLGSPPTTPVLVASKWLEGLEEIEIAREVRSSIAVVQSHVEKFKRVAWLCWEEGLNAFEISLRAGVPVALVESFMGLCAQYQGSAQWARRMQEIRRTGQTAFLAPNEHARSAVTA